MAGSQDRADSSQACRTGPTGREEREMPSAITGEPSRHPAQSKAVIYGSASDLIRNTWQSAGCGPARPLV